MLLSLVSLTSRYLLRLFRMFRVLGFLLLCGSFLTGQTSPKFSKAEDQIRSVVAAGAVPAISVSVTQHGRIVWEQGFGLADRERHIRATAETPFYLASVAKSLTSTALMVLRESGKLNLDSPVNLYLGAAKVHSPMWNANEATVRRVATHMAGLTTFYRVCNVGDSQCKISIEQEIERYGILFWPPGERFDYSNLGYAILGEAIAHVSRESFAKVLENSVFEPLGMTHCGLGGARGAAVNYDEYSHQRSPRQISGTPGASAVYCSAHDLALFALLQLKDHRPTQQQILSDAAIDELHHPVADVSGQGYAIGWWTEDREGERVIFGQGGTTDSFTLLELFPSEDLGIVILANSWSDNLKMPNGIEQTLLAALRQNLRARPQSSSAVLPHSPRPVAAQQLVGKWVGDIQTYAGRVPVEISVSASGEAHGRVGSGAQAELRSPSIEGEHVYGVLSADLHEPDAPLPPYDVEFDLFFRGNKLTGAVTTRPGKASTTQLPHWSELQKIGP
ncbi:MAG: serine hydrolase domain-containing protein [Candidatus Sulfotelmatobacter sp.]